MVAMKYDAACYPYASRRMVTYARRGMVAASQQLAAQAGLAMLQQGGNAVDAALATAACLTVVEPTSNGIGGDAFALVWANGKLHGLNASGPAPQGISLAAVRQKGLRAMPRCGWLPVNVPGIPAAWAALSARFGRLPLTTVLAPAVRYAREGYPVSPVVSRLWQEAYAMYAAECREEQFRYWFETFAPEGRPPAPGEMVRLPDHAATLEIIAATGAEAFYRGELAEKIDRFSQWYGGFLRGEDLAAYHPEWVEPIAVNYRGYDVWELPPNGHGLVALLALNILKGFTFPARDMVETYHRQLEAMKLAFADGLAYIAEPAAMKVSVAQLLTDDYAAMRRRQIGTTAAVPAPGSPDQGGTVYLAAADGDGTMVSYIQSNYQGFGSGLVVPGTGIALHNRGANFSLDPRHVNCLAPGKRPYHTIIPGFLTHSGRPVGPFGVMGAFMQPQGHVQVVMNTVDFALNPQAALDAPRWQWKAGRTVELEPQVPEHIARELAARGHDVCWSLDTAGFGRGQIIWRGEDGVLAGGTEPRADGTVAAW